MELQPLKILRKNTSQVLIFVVFVFEGGEPNSVAKLNIINLNKQAKLFSQGMQPVIRIGDCGKWERIRDNIKYSVSITTVHINQCKITEKFTSHPQFSH